jgi:uncharacterized protein (TIGR02466 family)
MKQQSLFPTPLWIDRFNDADQLSRWVQRVMVLRAADPIGVQLTNQGAWHSQTNLLQDPGLHDLFGWIAAQVQRALAEWGWDLEQARPRFNNAWAVISRSGDSHGAHIHPNSLFSGVFYLAAPSGSGAIAFLDPRAGALLLQPPFRREAASREIGRQRLVPEMGLLLLFPAWLWHEVELSSCQDPRICISFNVGMRPVPANAEG